MTAFLLQGFLYKSMGLEIPEATGDLTVSSAAISNTFCIIMRKFLEDLHWHMHHLHL